MPKITVLPQADAAAKKSRTLLIDLENCPNQIYQLMNKLEQYSQIVICYAQSGAKVPLDWILPLTAVVNEERLRIVKMPSAGKNAADFGIAFWAGMLMAQLASDAHFDIVSNDADLDHVVNLLIDHQRSAERIGPRKENSQEPLFATPPENAVQEYCRHLDIHRPNRPAKKDTLRNSIKSKFNGSEIKADALLEELVKHGAIAVKDNKVSYNDKRINELARLSS